MDSAKMNDWMQLLGMVAIVASLIFVGLQMKQSQEIAIATQYAERSSEAREFFMARAEMPDQLKELGLNHRDHLRAADGFSEDIELEELGRSFLVARAYLAMYENLHYQYQAGFLSDDAWLPVQNLIRMECTGDFWGSQVLINHRDRYRPSFMQLCDGYRNEAAEQ
jgi:hypothetical protein